MMPGEFDSVHVSEGLCLDLVLGLVPADARRVALDHMKACLACETQFQEIAASHTRAEATAARVLENGTPEARHVTVLNPPPSRFRWRTPSMVAAAAAVILLMFAPSLLQRGSHPEDPAARLEYRLPEARLRGAVRELQVTADDTLLTAGLRAYDHGDWPSARRLLSVAHGAGRLEDVRRIYLGSTLLQLGDASGACTLLEAIDPRVVPEPWKSEARWALALAFERAGRRQAADSIFSVLATETGPVADRARAHRQAKHRVGG